MRGEDDLAARVRACLASVDGVSERKMFGGVGFMLNGNILAGTSKRGLLLRVGKEHHAEAVAEHRHSGDGAARPGDGRLCLRRPAARSRRGVESLAQAGARPRPYACAEAGQNEGKADAGWAGSLTPPGAPSSLRAPGSSPGRSSGTMGVDRRRRSSERSVWSKELVALLRALSCWPWTASARRSALTRSAVEAGVASGSAGELRHQHVASFARFAIRTV